MMTTYAEANDEVLARLREALPDAMDALRQFYREYGRQELRKLLAEDEREELVIDMMTPRRARFLVARAEAGDPDACMAILDHVQRGAEKGWD